MPVEPRVAPSLGLASLLHGTVAEMFSRSSFLARPPIIAIVLLASCGGSASSGAPDKSETTSSAASATMAAAAMLDASAARGYKCLHEDANDQTILSYGVDTQASAGDASAFRVWHAGGVGPWVSLAQDGELYVVAPEPGNTSPDWYGNVLHTPKKDAVTVLDIPTRPSSCLPYDLQMKDVHPSADDDGVSFTAAFGDGTSGHGWLNLDRVDALVIERSDGEEIRVSINTPLQGGIWGLIYPADLPKSAASPVDDVVTRTQALTALFPS